MLHWDVYNFLKQVDGQITLHGLADKFGNIEQLANGIREYNEMAKRNPFFKEVQIHIQPRVGMTESGIVFTMQNNLPESK